MKRQILVEIEIPDGVDSCWDADKSGFQTLSDTVIASAMANTIKMLKSAITKCKEQGMTTETEMESDPFYQFIITKINIINESKMIGYIDDDGTINLHNETYTLLKDES